MNGEELGSMSSEEMLCHMYDLYAAALNLLSPEQLEQLADRLDAAGLLDEGAR